VAPSVVMTSYGGCYVRVCVWEYVTLKIHL